MKIICLILSISLGFVFNLCYGIFEEQLGEENWRIHSLGTDINHVIYGSKSMIIATKEILGSIIINSGEFEWRIILESSNDIEKMVKDAGANVIVSGSTIFKTNDYKKIINELRTK